MVAPDGLRVVFFGTPDFAVPTLDALLRSSHHVVCVVTQPDRPRGRGQKTSAGPVKQRALDAGIRLLQPDRLGDPAFVDALTALRADLGVVAAYGKILTDRVLAIPRLGMINVHASLLPRYRGAAPVHRAIMAGETETGVTIMRVVKALDAGPMLAKAVRAIGPDETSDALERDLAAIGAPLLVSTVDALAAGSVTETPQDAAAATYAPRLTKSDGVVDWSRSAGAIHNLIRGLRPWPHAYSWLNGQRIIFHRSSCPPLDGTTLRSADGGTILVASGERLTVATGRGALQLLTLQVEGRRPMSAREFLAGHAVVPGQRFVSAA
jgi:methionyl-tRNA formyltransferase